MKNLYKLFLIIFGLTLYLSQTISTANAATCNWKSRNPYTNFWDSCSGRANKYSVNGYLVFKSSTTCFKYQWTVNGKNVGTSNVLSYPITSNGSYTICVKVTDTCNSCDTTFCSTRTITCVNNCNWKSLNPSTNFWDSCNTSAKRYSLNGNISFKSGSCLSYFWSVNGNKAGYSSSMNYKITSNGTYKICIQVYDSCKRCDTTYCTTRTITCISGCNWKSNMPYYYQYMSDSCPTKYYYGYVGIKNTKGISYTWKANGNVIGTGASYKFTPSTAGYYTTCVVLYDSTNRCDTTMCKTFYYNCVRCNWKSRKPYLYGTDSCDTKYNNSFLRSNISFNYSTNCFKYQWTVNGTTVSNKNGFSYIVYKNGTYVVCLKVTDTCNNCDTSFCFNSTVTCLKGNTCNWKNQKAATGYWDSCNATKNTYSLNAYIAFSSKSCMKYQWTVNGNNAGNGNIMNYQIKQNGSYSVCVKVTDTCNNCDTTYCTTRTITCVKSTCNWKSRNPYFYSADSCDKRYNVNYIGGYIYFNYSKSSCFKYLWFVNGNVVSTNIKLDYTTTKNGSYTVCLKVTDTCNNCDTSFCFTRTVNCINGSSCNWKDRKPAHGYWDSCSGRKNKYSLNGYALFTNYYYKSCLKYQWTVNGNNAGNGDWMSYPITANGTYAVCVKVTDTCLNCDTTYCTTRTITCIGTTKCNWKASSPNYYFWDSCGSRRSSLNAYIAFGSKSCLKYQWMVNGNKAGNGNVMNYPITANGKYSVCVTVTDTCNKCDTTYCSSRAITCFSSKCNWKSKNAYLITKDTCINSLNKYSVNGVIYIPGSSTCFTYQWTVAGNNAGTNQYMNYAITKNGTYTVCVKVTDTCNKCDTTYCTSIKVSCIPAGINKVSHTTILKVYPNPTNGLVNLELMDGTSAYFLTNSMGQILQTGTLENGVNTLDMTKYSNGFYLIKVQTQNAILTEKISVQKR